MLTKVLWSGLGEASPIEVEGTVKLHYSDYSDHMP